MKIDVMIVGAEKSGTTSLKNYLNEHPEILGHSATEFTFFHSGKKEYELGFSNVFKKYYEVNELDLNNGKKIIAKNASIHTIKESIERLYGHNPNCKLIYCVRNPVYRTYSEYTYDISNNRINMIKFEKFKKIIISKDINNRFYRNYIGHSLYNIHLDMMLKYFPLENIKIVVLEEFMKRPEYIMRNIFQFIDVDINHSINTDKVYNKTLIPKSTFLMKMIYYLRMNKKVNNVIRPIIPFKLYKRIGSFLVEHNKSKKKFKPMDNDFKLFLIEYFKPYNRKFEKMINMDLSIWNRYI